MIGTNIGSIFNPSKQGNSPATGRKYPYFLDTFNNNTLNMTLWKYGAGSSGANIQATSQQLWITTDPTSNYYEIETQNTYVFTGAVAQVQVVSAGNQAFNSVECIMYLIKSGDENNKLYFTISENTITARTIVNGSNSGLASIAYNATAMQYERIRESGGTVYFDYSADSIIWTNLATTPTPTWGGGRTDGIARRKLCKRSKLVNSKIRQCNDVPRWDIINSL